MWAWYSYARERCISGIPHRRSLKLGTGRKRVVEAKRFMNEIS